MCLLESVVLLLESNLSRYGYGYTRDGRDDLNLPFNEATFQLIKEAFHLPPNFSKLLEEESTRCSRTTWFDADGNIEGLGIS
jgi:hypothetical protein